MLELVEYKKELRDKWNSFASEYGNLFHLIEWKEIFEEALGYECPYLLAMRDDKIVGLLPVVTGRNLQLKKVAVSIPFVNYLDICCINEEVFDFIVDSAKKYMHARKMGFFEFRLKDQVIKDSGAALNDRNYTLVLPLDGDEEKVMALSTSDNRNHTRKAYRNNCFSVSFDEPLDEFYKIYCKVMKRLGSPAPDIRFFRAIYGKLPENSILLSVKDAQTGAVIGGMTLLSFKDMLYYQWGGALAEYNKKYVNNFMYWEAIKYGLQNGYKLLDLGRSPNESGTFKFKKQFGAQPQKLSYYRFNRDGSTNVTVESEKYRAFVSMWKVLPSFFTDLAGRKLIKYVMP